MVNYLITDILDAIYLNLGIRSSFYDRSWSSNANGNIKDTIAI